MAHRSGSSYIFGNSTVKDRFAEYIKQMTETSYQTAIRHYQENHACCPQCGSDNVTQTLLAFTFDVNNPQEYKDLNESRCNGCGHLHRVHDQVPMKS